MSGLKIFVLTAATVLLSSCISIRVRQIHTENFPIQPVITVYECNDSLLIIAEITYPTSLQKNANNNETKEQLKEKLDFIYDMTMVETEIFYKDKKLANQMVFNEIPEIPDKDDNISTTARFCQYLIWDVPYGIEKDSLRFNFSFVKTVNTYKVSKTYREMSVNQIKETEGKSAPKPSIIMFPFCKKADDKVEFGAISFRIGYNKDEYLPTSENFRYEIFSPKGEMMKNSYENVNFLQVITPLAPSSFGGKQVYAYSWNGKNKAGGKAVNGEYSIKMNIPANPMPYFNIINFTRTYK